MRMLKNALILILFLLNLSAANAQYFGGEGDGYAMGETKNIALGTDEVLAGKPMFKIFPNPSNIANGFTVNFDSQSLLNWIEIYNITGQLKYKTITGSSGNMKINLSGSGIKKGVYILIFKNNIERSFPAKIVVTD